MPTRLPDTAFTSDPMFGAVPSEGAEMTGPTFSQGETAGFSIFLVVDGVPLSLGAYNLIFVVKKSETAANVMYRTKVTEHPAGAPEGFVVVSIPAHATALMQPGTYYFTFVASTKAAGTVSVVKKGTFNIELTAASPNPKLTLADGDLTADGDSVCATSRITPAENTGPGSPDITHIGF